MEEKKNNKGLIIGLIIFLIVCLIGSGYFVYKIIYIDNNNSNEIENDDIVQINEKKDEQNIEDQIDTFSNVTNSGKVRVKGYAVVNKQNECEECEGSKEYEYVYFYITDTKSQEFIDYVKSLQGNAFATDNAIGLGCIENNILSYVNDNDELGMNGYSLTKEETSKIINSSKDKTITLEIERFKLTGGSDAPICYSHITNIKIID